MANLSWIEIDAKIYVVAYYSGNRALIYPLIDYCSYLSDVKELSVNTVRDRIYYLSSFYDFLEKEHLEVPDITDQLLIRFRNKELALVENSPNSSSNRNAHLRTVNAKIRCVYSFIAWFQENVLNSKYLIGRSDCRVTSTINSESLVGSGRVKYRTDRSLFPTLFKNDGGTSKHKTRYIATAEDESKLQAYFKESHTEYVAVRNILLMRIASIVGQRRAAINSFVCSQFSESKIHAANEDYVTITPAQQKFSYTNSFEFAWELCWEIRAFIEDHRLTLIREMGWSEDRTLDRVFISARDGKPLSPQSISAIFGKAFRAIGAPPGSGIHSFRRKFANDSIVEEITSRHFLGLDTSVASVSASVAIAMGHSNPDSLAPYVSREMGRLAQTLAKRKRE